ncbi:MAG: ribonuclease Z [Bacteroidetes bacterium]|nr:MAG: ribonuclease Z [Bacteroidota bacterium]
MIFELVILGNSSATPTLHRFPSAQYLKMLDHHMLIDCGEGTQIQMQRYKIKKSKIKHIFISHIHADHMLGLPGLLFSMSLMQRTEPLHIYGPETLFEILDLFTKNTESELRFEIIKHITNPDVTEVIFEDSTLKVSSFPLYHRIPTTGFLFQEQSKLHKLNTEACEKHNIPFTLYTDIKRGKDFISADGSVHVKNKELTFSSGTPISYAYCSDTMYHKNVIEAVSGVDLLYHEATFMHDKLARAEETKHSTARQAGMVAQQANVKKLIIGHFSSRYDVLDELLAETRAVFENSFIANEGEHFLMNG